MTTSPAAMRIGCGLCTSCSTSRRPRSISASGRDARRRAYEADVTYLTANEAGFDYLRDHLELRPEDVVQRPVAFAIVDEVDSILIDEARIPLVSAGGARSSAHAHAAVAVVRQLIRGQDYVFDENQRNVILTDAGVARSEALLGIANLYEVAANELHASINDALQAEALLRRDVEYVIRASSPTGEVCKQEPVD
jgi:preprotein translocase subunit SecA